MSARAWSRSRCFLKGSPPPLFHYSSSLRTGSGARFGQTDISYFDLIPTRFSSNTFLGDSPSFSIHRFHQLLLLGYNHHHHWYHGHRNHHYRLLTIKQSSSSSFATETATVRGERNHMIVVLSRLLLLRALLPTANRESFLVEFCFTLRSPSRRDVHAEWCCGQLATNQPTLATDAATKILTEDDDDDDGGGRVGSCSQTTSGH